jgi:hypothetical protein
MEMRAFLSLCVARCTVNRYVPPSQVTVKIIHCSALANIAELGDSAIVSAIADIVHRKFDED